MTASPFAAPSTMTGIDYKEINGRLLLIEPLREETITTVHGPNNAIHANVVVLDGTDAGTRYDETIIFPKVLANQVRPKIGEKVLGRLGQGQAKTGQSAPWILAEATPSDIEVGVQYLNNRTAGQFQQPTTQQQAPATNTGGQPPF